jgi:hypothetical protein
MVYTVRRLLFELTVKCTGQLAILKNVISKIAVAMHLSLPPQFGGHGLNLQRK